MPPRPTDFSTTKWLRSQCRMQGVRSMPELVELEPQRPRGEADPVGDADQVLQRRALEREAEAAAQRGRVGVLAVVARDHREAGEAAFGGLGLQHHRQPPAPAELQPVGGVHARLLPVSE